MHRLEFGSWDLVVGVERLGNNYAKNSPPGSCAKAVGGAQHAWGKIGGFIHIKFSVLAICAKNVFFYHAFTRNFTAPVHTVSAYFQSVIARLCTVCTGLTKTTTIKLYVYIEGVRS